MTTLIDVQDWTLTSLDQVFLVLQSAGIDIKKLEDQQGEFVPVLYRNVRFNLLVPQVEFIGGDQDHAQFHTFSQIVHTGTVRKGLLAGPSRTRRIFRITLRNTAVAQLSRSMTDEMVRAAMDAGTWHTVGFWNVFAEAMMEAHTKAAAMPRINREFVEFLFNRTITNTLARIEVAKSSAHISAHCRTWELAYPGRDRSQGVIRADLDQNVVYEVRRAFHQKAVDIGCDITVTSKGHPGRCVVFAPKGFSPSLGQLWLFPHFGCQTRAPREMYSSVPNAQRFEVERHKKPLVTSDLGDPNSLISDNRVKFTNCAYLSFDDVVELHDGEYINADQVLGTGWSHIDNTFGTIEERIHREPYVEGETEDEVLERMKARFGDDIAVSPNVRADGLYFEINWDVVHIHRENSRMAWKAANPDAVKGFVIPERRLFVEKREGEDFYRPIYLFFASESVVKKDAGRSVLRMLLSRLPDAKDRLVNHATPRSEFQATLSDVREKLSAHGDDGTSSIHEFKPLKLKGNGAVAEAMRKVTTVPVMGFTEMDGKIVPIGEDEIGILHGDIEDVLTPDGEQVRTVVGEMPILRMPEDEDFGREVRMREKYNGIRLDPFLVLGKPGLDFPSDPRVKDRLNFSVQLYHAIGYAEVDSISDDTEQGYSASEY